MAPVAVAAPSHADVFAVATAQARVGTIRTCLCGSVTQFALLGGLDTLVDRVHRAVQHHTNAYVIVGRPQ